MSIDLSTAIQDRNLLKGIIKGALDQHAFTKLEEMRVEVASELLQIDELSKSTLGSYITKATADVGHHARQGERRAAHAADSMKRAKDPKLTFASSANKQMAAHDTKKSVAHTKKGAKRELGIGKAVSKLVNK